MTKKHYLGLVLALFMTTNALTTVASAKEAYTLKNSENYQLVEEWTVSNTGTSDTFDANINLKYAENINSPYQKSDELTVLNNRKEVTVSNSTDKKDIYIPAIKKDETITFKTIRDITISGIKYTSNSLNSEADYNSFPDLNKYTSPEEKIQSNSNEIKSLSTQIEGSETNAYKKAKKIFEYVNTEINYDESEGNKGALNALITKKGVCEDFANLFVAMLRAQGIPSRMVYGYRIEDTRLNENMQEITNTAHAWAEFYTPDCGWVIVEPTVIYSDTKGKRYVSYTDFANAERGDHIITSYADSSRIESSYKTVSGGNLKIQKRAFLLKNTGVNKEAHPAITVASKSYSSIAWSFKYPYKCSKFMAQVYSDNKLIQSIDIPYNPNQATYQVESKELLPRTSYTLTVVPYFDDYFGEKTSVSEKTEPYNLKDIAVTIKNTSNTSASITFNHEKVDGDKITIYNKSKKPIKQQDYSSIMSIAKRNPSIFSKDISFFIQINNSKYNAQSDLMQINATLPGDSLQNVTSAYWNNVKMFFSGLFS